MEKEHATVSRNSLNSFNGAMYIQSSQEKAGQRHWTFSSLIFNKYLLAGINTIIEKLKTKHVKSQRWRSRISGPSFYKNTSK